MKYRYWVLPSHVRSKPPNLYRQDATTGRLELWLEADGWFGGCYQTTSQLAGITKEDAAKLYPGVELE